MRTSTQEIEKLQTSLFDLLSQEQKEDSVFRFMGMHPNVGISNPDRVKIVMPSHPDSKNGRKRRLLWSKQNGLCAYCDVQLETPQNGTLDHIIPRVKGGKSAMGNLALVCSSCNALKSWFSSVKEVEEFTGKLLIFFHRLQAKGILK